MKALMMKRMVLHLSKKELCSQDGHLLARYIRLPRVFSEVFGGIYLEILRRDGRCIEYVKMGSQFSSLL